MPLGSGPQPIGSPLDLQLSDQTWVEVLDAVDRTYAELVGHQEQRERRNHELERLRRFPGPILASVSDVLIFVDCSGTVDEVSASLTKCSGAPRADVVGTAPVALFVPKDRAPVTAALARVRAERAAIMVEAALLATQGDFAPDPGIATRLDDRGRLTGFVLAGRPVGEIKQASVDLSRSHDDLKAAQALLVRNEKLASLGRPVAGVAHELNNPISFVYGNPHALDRYATKFETNFDRVQAGASREELIRLREELRLDREIRNLRTAVQGARDGAERVRDIVEDLRRLVEAARGALGHWITVRGGRIAACRVVAPTTWNFSPRDATGQPGPVEAALEGAVVHPGEVTLLSVQHIVRRFDPCMVCTVH